MKPRRGKIVIAKNIYQHTFGHDGVALHLITFFYKYLIPTGLINSSIK